MRVVAVAISPQEGNEALRVAFARRTQRDRGRPALPHRVHHRRASAATLSGVGEENSATGRHIRRLIELRGWAKPLELPEERVTYHVLESDKPGAALVDYVRMNDVARAS